MATAALQQELQCSVCMNTYKAPTTLPCGHTFCKECIQKTIETSNHRSCPECRCHFGKDLKRNTKMCSIIELLNSTKSKPAKNKGGCSYCDGTAKKLCLDCEAPLCCDHLSNHPAGHVLTDLSTDLQSRRCPVHQELFKYYCTKDGVTICASCGLIGDHKQHDIKKLSDLSNKEKSGLQILESHLTKKQAEKEKTVTSVKTHKESIVSRTEMIRNLVTGVIGDLKKELESVEHLILCQITTQEDQILSQASQVIKNLDGQISEIRKHIKEIQSLCNVSDPITLLERKASSAHKAQALLNEESNFYVQNVDGGILQVLLLSSLSRLMRNLPFLLKNRGIHTEDATSGLLPLCQVTKNVPPFLIMTLDGQNVEGPQFTSSTSTISSGQHYWEVETSDQPYWAVGVSYHKECHDVLGYSNNSWCLQLSDDQQYKAVHGSEQVNAATSGPVKALGVYVEYETGIVSFYRLSNNSVECICSMNAKFTRPLYIVMYVKHGGWMRIGK